MHHHAGASLPEDTSCPCACGPEGFLTLGKPGFTPSLPSRETKGKTADLQGQWSQNPGSPGPDTELEWLDTLHLSRVDENIEPISTAGHSRLKERTRLQPCKNLKAHSLQTHLPQVHVLMTGPVSLKAFAITLICSKMEGQGGPPPEEEVTKQSPTPSPGLCGFNSKPEDWQTQRG